MLLAKYLNGNATVELFDDGTRIVTALGPLELDFPFNIDIRLSERCAFGLNQKTNTTICGFCHESATTDGADGDVEKLLNVLDPIPPFVELAVGVNQYDDITRSFLVEAKHCGWIVNTTINQGHLRKYHHQITTAIHCGLIHGLGISYRKGMILPEGDLLDYPNTVVHVIAGIDDIDDVLALSSIGVKKILVLGEKDFGFNKGKLHLTADSRFWWYRRIHELFAKFDVVSFDNLALQQLNIKRFVKDWDTVYQHEYSMYINAVQQYFAPSSRDSNTTPWNAINIRDYFKTIAEKPQNAAC